MKIRICSLLHLPAIIDLKELRCSAGVATYPAGERWSRKQRWGGSEVQWLAGRAEARRYTGDRGEPGQSNKERTEITREHCSPGTDRERERKRMFWWSFWNVKPISISPSIMMVKNQNHEMEMLIELNPSGWTPRVGKLFPGVPSLGGWPGLALQLPVMSN